MRLSKSKFTFGEESRETGWIQEAVKLRSPNWDLRPEGVLPDLIVIHCISLPPGEFGGKAIDHFFCNMLDCSAHPFYDQIRDLEVSAHFLIRRDGELCQFVSCDKRARHAGVSTFCGRDGCSDFSIGIELEGICEEMCEEHQLPDTVNTTFEAIQYQVLAQLINPLCSYYPINAIAGHRDIAPGRKTDPGQAFDWQRVVNDTGLDKSYFPFQFEKNWVNP